MRGTRGRGRAAGTRAAAAGAVALGALLAAAGPARGQAPDPAAADSVADRARAVDAQAALERSRVARMGWALGRGGSGCDEVIGRFCLTHDEGGPAWVPPPAPPVWVREREALLALLAEVALRRPGDGWVQGQRVRYLVEAGRPAEAVAAARACRAEGWWCRALEGTALHAAGDAGQAEASFDAALAAMDPATRTAWEDPRPLLDARARRRWDAARGAARADLARRLWWLADPFWSDAGNDRRSEHFARRTLDRAQSGARSGYDVAWGNDLRAILVRYGWPAGWERIRATGGALAAGGPPILAHDPPDAVRFEPDDAVLADPAIVPPAAWRLDAPKPRATYAPAWAGRFVDLAPQIAVFPRGDRAVVVAAWDLAPDSLAPDAAADAALVVAAGPEGPPAVARARTARAGALAVEAPRAPGVVSLEVRAPAAGVAGRARGGLLLPRGPLSDLLLLRAGARPPETLEAAALLARPDAAVVPGEALPVYFEIAAPPGAGAARVAVTLEDGRGGLRRGIARALGLGRASASVLAWDEALPAGGGTVGRAIEVALPRDLGEGAWTLEVAVETGGAVARAHRRLEVGRPGG